MIFKVIPYVVAVMIGAYGHYVVSDYASLKDQLAEKQNVINEKQMTIDIQNHTMSLKDEQMNQMSIDIEDRQKRADKYLADLKIGWKEVDDLNKKIYQLQQSDNLSVDDAKFKECLNITEPVGFQ